MHGVPTNEQVIGGRLSSLPLFAAALSMDRQRDGAWANKALAEAVGSTLRVRSILDGARCLGGFAVATAFVRKQLFSVAFPNQCSSLVIVIQHDEISCRLGAVGSID
jgi:hypothetical protein